MAVVLCWPVVLCATDWYVSRCVVLCVGFLLVRTPLTPATVGPSSPATPSLWPFSALSSSSLQCWCTTGSCSALKPKTPPPTSSPLKRSPLMATAPHHQGEVSSPRLSRDGIPSGQRPLQRMSTWQCKQDRRTTSTINHHHNSMEEDTHREGMGGKRCDGERGRARQVGLSFQWNEGDESGFTRHFVCWSCKRSVIDRTLSLPVPVDV